MQTYKPPENENPHAGSAGAIKNKRLDNSKFFINFKAINRAAIATLPSLLRQLLPDGRKIGREWVACNPIRADHHAGSFSVNMRTGRWGDFATGETGGDVISLIAYLNGIRQGEAAKRLAGMLGVRHDK